MFIFTAGPPAPPTPPQDEKPTVNIEPSPPVQESVTPSEHTNSLKKPQAPAVPEDDGFTR